MRSCAFLHPQPVRPTVGRRPGDPAAAPPPGGATRSATSPPLDRRPSSVRAGGPTAATSSTWPTAVDDRPWSRIVRPSRSATRRRSPTTSTTSPTSAGRSTRLADAVASRLRAHDLGARTLTLKVRDGAFATITRATTLAGAVDTADAIGAPSSRCSATSTWPPACGCWASRRPGSPRRPSSCASRTSSRRAPTARAGGPPGAGGTLARRQPRHRRGARALRRGSHRACQQRRDGHRRHPPGAGRAPGGPAMGPRSRPRSRPREPVVA